MKTFKCDVCGTTYNKYYGFNTVILVKDYPLSLFSNKINFDLCRECSKKIKRFLRFNDDSELLHEKTIVDEL